MGSSNPEERSALSHAPDVGENESALGKRVPSVLAGQKGAIEKTGDAFTFLTFPVFERTAAHMQFLGQLITG